MAKSSVPNDEEAARRKAEQTGAGWAVEFIESVRRDPELFELGGWVDDAQTLLFKDRPEELRSFFLTLREAIVKAPLPPDVTKWQKTIDDMNYVGTLILSALRLARKFELDDSSPIEALCEKAGFICDRVARQLGSGMVCGSWENWAEQSGSETGTEAAG